MRPIYILLIGVTVVTGYDVISDMFMEIGRMQGLADVSGEYNPYSKSGCSLYCIQENCISFSVASLQGFHFCVLANDLTSLSNVMEWTVYVRKAFVSGSGILVLNRSSDAVDFYQDWAAYKSGFGDPDTNYWIGLDLLHLLTTSRQYGVRVEMTDWADNSYWAYYSSFSVGPESDNYRLSVSGYDVTSTAPDKFSRHDSMKFTTKDADNDVWGGNCAVETTGGWWYIGCYDCNPTGTYLYGGVNEPIGIVWKSLNGHPTYYSLKTIKFTIIAN